MANTWVQTYTGKSFDVLNPDPAKVDIIDIAHSLANLCRFGGHCKRFYSVAQHSILVNRYVCRTGSEARFALLHDASEAYLLDLPSPIKRAIPDYKLVEGKIQQAIWERYDLSHVAADVDFVSFVKQVDLMMCAAAAVDSAQVSIAATRAYSPKASTSKRTPIRQKKSGRGWKRG